MNALDEPNAMAWADDPVRRLERVADNLTELEERERRRELRGWRGVALFVAGIVCAPLFLIGVWFACWLVAGMPR